MTKSSSELIDEIIQVPSLDEFMKRDPATLTDEDYANIVEHLRNLRAEFIEAEEKKSMKKQGVS